MPVAGPGRERPGTEESPVGGADRAPCVALSLPCDGRAVGQAGAVLRRAQRYVTKTCGAFQIARCVIRPRELEASMISPSPA